MTTDTTDAQILSAVSDAIDEYDARVRRDPKASNPNWPVMVYGTLAGMGVEMGDVPDGSDPHHIATLADGREIHEYDASANGAARYRIEATEPVSRIEICEDNAGGLWLVPIGEGIMIEMPETGDALTDCRTYGDDWDRTTSPPSVWPLNDDELDDMVLVATYDTRSRDWTHDLDPESMGRAARTYFGIDLEPLADRYVDELADMGVTVLHAERGEVVCDDQGPGFRATAESIIRALDAIRGQEGDTAAVYEAFHAALAG